MPKEGQEAAGPPSRHGSAPSPGADDTLTAATVLTRWQAIDTALRPVIGPRGVAALYGRSLALASAQHPWLAACRPGILEAIDTTALHQALLQQPPAEATAGGMALFKAFRNLLDSLIGAPLADRLLRDVNPPPSPSAVQDPAS